MVSIQEYREILNDWKSSEEQITGASTNAKGKLFPYYFCQNGKCEFYKKSIRKKDIEHQLEEKANELELLTNNLPVKNIDLSIPYRNALDKAVGLVENPYPVWANLELSEQHKLFFFIFEKKLEYSKKEGYRNDNLPCAVRLFEEFATSNCLDVEEGILKSHAKKELKWVYNA